MELRKALEQITQSSQVGDHPDLISALNEKYPHNIKLIEQAGAAPSPYNCFMYSLGVADDMHIASILRTKAYTSLKFGTDFINYLVRHGQLVQSNDGAIAIYFVGKAPQHAGLYISPSRVVSKWGRGHLWEHDILEVPYNYGSTVLTFTTRGRIAEVFEVFAQDYD